MSPADKRLTLALLLSLLIHLLLLSLTFGGRGLGLPGFGFPWQDRRIEAPDLRVVVVSPQVIAAEPAVTPVAEPLPQARVEQPIAKGRAPTQLVSRAPTPQRTAAAIKPESNPKAEVNSRTDAAPDAAPAQTPFRADQPGETAPPPIPAPPVIATERTDETPSVVPATPAAPTPVIVAAPIDKDSSEREVEPAKPEPSKQEAQRQAEQLEAARQEAARQDAARVENARLEAERQEAARQAAEQQEAARQAAERKETARQEAERNEAERREAERKEVQRVEAQRIEAQRIEAERKEAERRDAERKEAQRIEAQRIEAQRKEGERKEAERKEAERREAAQVAQDAAARREAALRAIGRQLDEEAAQREAATAAARQSPSLPYSYSSARRYRLFGRADPNAEVILYAEAWARKIQLNPTFDMVREAAKQPHADPLVTVAIRSDGSVESVTFVHSSGVAALDEAIRRVIDSQKPYPAFPPELARDYDVIEIRRTWYFDMAIRLY